MCTALILPSVLTISTVLDELLLYLVHTSDFVLQKCKDINMFIHTVSVQRLHSSPVLQLVSPSNAASSFFPRATKAPTCESLVVKPRFIAGNEN